MMGGEGIKYERRLRINKEQTDFLKNLFIKSPYLRKKEKTKVSEYLRVPVTFINNWFQNMRAFVRKRLNYTKQGYINKCSKTDPEDIFNPTNRDVKRIASVIFM